MVDKKKIANGSRCNDMEIDFCIIGKVGRMFLKNVEVNTGELQHNLGVVNADWKQERKQGG